ncbi:hypothetical protein DL770_011955 [Monosporascus sp. CRB-9-2]|nr:hypothetical protein DL770_011955 [Monosporascus sp. CRB-9-2]
MLVMKKSTREPNDDRKSRSSWDYGVTFSPSSEPIIPAKSPPSLPSMVLHGFRARSDSSSMQESSDFPRDLESRKLTSLCSKAMITPPFRLEPPDVGKSAFWSTAAKLYGRRP